jgi:hypothetical protein
VRFHTHTHTQAARRKDCSPTEKAVTCRVFFKGEEQWEGAYVSVHKRFVGVKRRAFWRQPNETTTTQQSGKKKEHS